MTDQQPTDPPRPDPKNTTTPDHSPERPPVNPRRRKVILSLLCVLVFVAGLVSGVGVCALCIRHRFHLRSRNPQAFPERVSRHMQWKFDLTDEKTQRIEAILTQRLDKLLKLHRDIQPTIEQEMSIAEEEVAQELTPDQALQWRKWFNRRCREHWRPPPPRRGPDRD